MAPPGAARSVISPVVKPPQSVTTIVSAVGIVSGVWQKIRRACICSVFLVVAVAVFLALAVGSSLGGCRGSGWSELPSLRDAPRLLMDVLRADGRASTLTVASSSI